MLTLLLLFIANSLFAIPHQINYRGKLFESGTPASGNRNMEFRIYNALTGGVQLWTSGVQSVAVNAGLYNFTMGTNPVIPITVFTNDFTYLEVIVNGTPLVPRERFVSVPYAYKAEVMKGSNLIQASGKVGIGKNNPTVALDVKGRISADRLIMKSNAANGRILTSDATGLASWQTPASIGGSGTLNYIPKFTGTGTTIGNSLLYDTGSKIGLGTLSPNSLLHVNAPIGETPLQIQRVGATKFLVSTNYGLTIGALTMAPANGLRVTGESYMVADVGIGTLPLANARLGVTANLASGYAAYFFNDGNSDTRWGVGIQCGTDDGTSSSSLMRFYDGDGSFEGSISSASGVVSYNAFTGSHYGEISKQQKPEIGDVLVQTGTNRQLNASTTYNGEPIYGVQVSMKEKDKRIIGVCGGNFEDLEGKPKEKDTVLINAVGNCYVKVTDSNGDIEAGDFVTTSSRPGMAQKQTEETLMNYTLGKAQETVRWKDVKVDPKKGYKWKYIPIAITSG